jgi:hypothetical protein
MTCLILPLLLASSQSPFDQALAAHSALVSFKASIQVVSKSRGVTAKTGLGMTAVGQNILLHIEEPPKPGLDRTSRTYRVLGTRFLAYDERSNEWLDRDDLAGAERLARLKSAIGDPPEVVGILLSGNAMKGFLARFRSIGGWKTTTSPSIIRVSRGSGPSASLTFGAKDHLLHELHLKNSSSELTWTISYAKAGPLR